jgi:phage protein
MNREKKPGMESVKIGGLTYDVKKSSDLQGKNGNWGQIQYKTQEIMLDDSLKEQVEDQTLIHEITHGILVEAGYNDHEEDLADRVGKVLYQVLTDNDFSWLYKGG